MRHSPSGQGLSLGIDMKVKHASILIYENAPKGSTKGEMKRLKINVNDGTSLLQNYKEEMDGVFFVELTTGDFGLSDRAHPCQTFPEFQDESEIRNIIENRLRFDRLDRVLENNVVEALKRGRL